MKLIKLILSITLCAAMLLSLCACSDDSPAVTSGSSPDASTPEPSGASGLSTGSLISDVPIFSTSAPPQTSGQEVTFTTTPPQTSPSTTTTAAPPVVDPNSVLLSVVPPSTDTHGLSDSEIFAFYDDAVFVGDSISLGWRNYVTKTRKRDSLFFGGTNGAQFLVSGSLGAGNALWEVTSESVHPSYQGEQMQLWKSIPLTGAKKVFVMFGLNDVALYGVDKTIENFGTLFGKIREAVPDVQFYVLSATYVKAGGERGKLNSANLRALNVALIDFCAQNGYEFINIADALADADGNLKAAYCSDGYVHQTDLAYEVWTSLLKGYAAAQLSSAANP